MRLSAATTVVIAALAAAPAAFADTSTSANWAGFAAHKPGVNFHRVTGSWIQPAAACTPGMQSFSAFWVGIGGYYLNSTALEQVGTEVDCNANGGVVSSAWFELVPAASQTVKLVVKPGDAITASVTVNGQQVTVSLKDLTRHRSFVRTIHAAVVDTTSAEWIAEAPSDCISATSCQTLPLADFGSLTFGLAGAQSRNGHNGTISDRSWQTTKISLAPGGRRFVANQGSGILAGAASPSGLLAKGSAFKVNYSQVYVQPTPTFRARATAGGRLVHPRR